MSPAQPQRTQPPQVLNAVSESAQDGAGPQADKARKWMWMLLAALVAMQMYFVQELLAALVLFTFGFLVLVGAVVAVIGLRKVSGRGLAWSQRIRVVAMAIGEDVSRKLLRRPRSEPAQ